MFPELEKKFNQHAISSNLLAWPPDFVLKVFAEPQGKVRFRRFS